MDFTDHRPMLPLLFACESEPEAVGDHTGASHDTASDSGSDGETGDDSGLDTGDDSGSDSGADTAEDIPVGPHCDSEGDAPIDTPFNVLAGHVVAGTANDAELADLHTLVESWAPGQNGPWTHGVRGPFVSTDSVAFAGDESVVLYAASVPDVAVRSDGTLVMLFVDGDLDAMLDAADTHTPLRTGFIGFGGLGAATSTDGVRWTPAALTFDEPLPTYAVDPELLALPDGTWVLYFYGVPAAELCANAPDPFLVPTAHRLYQAVSDDLLAWTGVTEVWQNPAGGVDPSVWCVDDARCYGWFSAGMVSDDGGASFVGTDAISASWNPQVPEVVRLGSGEWRMYSMSAGVIEAAFSDDALSWSQEGSTGLLSGSPTVIVGAGDELRMWASGAAE